MSEPNDLERSEIEAVIETRRELGATYEPALVDSFAEKVELAITTRVDAELARRQRDTREDESRGKRQMVLGIVSLGTGIPITAIAGGITDLPGILVAWAGIAAVNLAHAFAGARRR